MKNINKKWIIALLAGTSLGGVCAWFSGIGANAAAPLTNPQGARVLTSTTLLSTAYFDALQGPQKAVISALNLAKYVSANPQGPSVLVAGTTTVTPESFTAGTLNTTAAAGGEEFDGTTFYFTSTAAQRQVLDTESYQYITTPFVLGASQTTAQQALNVTTNGAVPVKAATAYHFACQFAMTGMSTASGSFGFALGLLNSATLTSQAWTAQAQKSATSVTAATSQITYNTAANVALATASTTTTGNFTVDGVMVVNAAGSVQPQISLGVAATPTIAAGSGCTFHPLGTAAAYLAGSIGGWN